MKCRVLKERENSGLPSDRPALGRFKEGRAVQGREGITPGSKDLAPRFLTLLRIQVDGRLNTLQLRYKGQGCLFSRHLYGAFSGPGEQIRSGNLLLGNLPQCGPRMTRILFRHLGEFVGEGVDDELEAIGDAEL